MPTITFDVPEVALSALRLSPCEFVREMRVAAALLWYSRGVEGYVPRRDASGLADERIAMSRLFMYGDCRLWVPPVVRSETGDIPPGETSRRPESDDVVPAARS